MDLILFSIFILLFILCQLNSARFGGKGKATQRQTLTEGCSLFARKEMKKMREREREKKKEEREGNMLNEDKWQGKDI